MRLAFWVLAFVIGVLCGVAGGTGSGIGLAVFGVVGAFWFAGRRWWTLGCACFAFALGIGHGWHQSRAAARREQGLSAMTPTSRLCVFGRVTETKDPPRVDDPMKASSRRFIVTGLIEPAGEGLANVKLRVNVLVVPEYGEPFDPNEGDIVQVCGIWQTPFGFFNPGAGAGWPQVALKNDAGSLRATHATLVKRGPRWWPTYVATTVRKALSRALNTLPLERASFLRATVLGERSAVDPQIELGFKAAGATHALSVSGLHLAAVAALFFVGLRRLLLAWSKAALVFPVVPLSAALSIPAVVFYTLITGEAVATWRSALMACCVFAGYVLRRKPAIAASLAFAAGLIVASSAYWLWDVSFQLSVVSVAGLALFAGRLGATTFVNTGVLSRCRSWFAKGLAATAAAGLLTAPLVAYHFGEITPAAPIGNLVLTPLVELLLVPLGLLGSCLAFLFPSAASILLWPANVSALITLQAAKLFARFAPVWHVNPAGLWSTLAITFGIGCALWAVRETDVRRRKWIVCALSLWCCSAGVWQYRSWRNAHREGVRITFLDVGQGDSAVVQGPDGFVAVIDGGGIGATFDTGERLVVPFLRREGISKIDLVVLSHPHPDHASGLFAVLKNFKVTTLWMPASTEGPEHDGFFTKGLREVAISNGTKVPSPRSYSKGTLLVQPLGPWDGDNIAAPAGLSVNDASLSVKVAYGGRSVFFAGDLEAPGELELSERARLALGDPHSDVLKVPHHGSRTSSSVALLDAVQPRIAVISAGRGNRFGFPHVEVMERYRVREVGTLRTDRDGAVQLEWSETRAISATCWRPLAAPCAGF